MDASTSKMPDDPLLQRLLNALKLNRTPGFHSPGHFLRISFDQMSPSTRQRCLRPMGPGCAPAKSVR